MKTSQTCYHVWGLFTPAAIWCTVMIINSFLLLPFWFSKVLFWFSKRVHSEINILWETNMQISLPENRFFQLVYWGWICCPAAGGQKQPKHLFVFSPPGNGSILRSYLRGEALPKSSLSTMLACFLVYRSIPCLRNAHTQLEGKMNMLSLPCVHSGFVP